jgi:hypothetical protein
MFCGYVMETAIYVLLFKIKIYDLRFLEILGGGYSLLCSLYTSLRGGEIFFFFG